MYSTVGPLKIIPAIYISVRLRVSVYRSVERYWRDSQKLTDTPIIIQRSFTYVPAALGTFISDL